MNSENGAAAAINLHIRDGFVLGTGVCGWDGKGSKGWCVCERVASRQDISDAKTRTGYIRICQEGSHK